ncbi:hypothetical protein SAMN05444285_10145 [Draconibacterium orientale]|uniref:Uncharacterized protein n=1 Tax=Draconibacterium orientale TaxID=1168034 RepID=A0A1H9Y5H6_9BACT|nr:hypothetical protein SAMN05444285_10145 [Draconibacterium orientale]
MVTATPPDIKVAAVTHITLDPPDEQLLFCVAAPKMPINPAATPVIANVWPFCSKFSAF